MTFEQKSTELARALRDVCEREPDNEVIASALVELTAQLAHARRAPICGSFIDPRREMRAIVDADCVCPACPDERPIGAAADLL